MHFIIFLRMNLFLLVCAFEIFVQHVKSKEVQDVSCSTRQTVFGDTLFSKTGMSLKGHVRRTLEKTTFIQCSLRCLKEDWCISVNFEIQKRMGKCEMNDYGVEDETSVSIEKGEFGKKKGFVYAQLKPAGSGCHDNTCQNDGTCVMDCTHWQPRCNCPSGFRGDRCEELENSGCSSNPCLYGGICTDLVSGFSCTCAAGYSGTKCEIDINECSSNPCLHGGTCTDQVNGFSCTCAAGYNGTKCEIDIDECSSNPCLHGGTCTDLVSGFSCSCAAGYNGARCENDIDECSSNPCLHGGTCTDQVNGFSCTCAAGYNGTRCENDCDLHFPSAKISNSIIIDSAFQAQLSDFTVSFWLKVSNKEVILYPFSYATSSITSAFVIGIKDDGKAEITVRGETKSLSSGIQRDNTWQHCAITWKSSIGKVIFYHGGSKTDFEHGLKKGKNIPSGGKMVIGQYQGSYGSGYDTSKLMLGYLADLNIWSIELTPSEITSLSSKCFTPLSSAPVLSWPTIISKPLGGQLNKTCPATCPRRS